VHFFVDLHPRKSKKLGCLKLTYEETKPTFKVVYGGLYEGEKVVQRFLSVDPLAAQAPGWTPYRYCFDNPVNLVDPSGLFEDDYYFNKRGDLVEHVVNDQPDRFFIRETSLDRDLQMGNDGSLTATRRTTNTEIDLNSDLGVLARIGFAEFRGGNLKELEAGLDVTMNRLNARYRKAETMMDVVTQKKQYSSLNASEATTNGPFFWNPLDKMAENRANTNAFINSMSQAIKVYNGFSGITDKALRYYSPRSMDPSGSRPYWHTNNSEVIDIPGARPSFITVIR
jgi:hypothetical protein